MDGQPLARHGGVDRGDAAVYDLLVHLRFDETTGAIAADASGSGLDGMLVNGPVFAGGQDPFIAFTSAPPVFGHTYLLQTIDNLTTGICTNLSDPVVGSGLVIEFIAPYSSTGPLRFYRIQISR